MRKSSLLEFLDDFLGARDVNGSRGEIVATMYDLIACNLNKCDCLGVSWFKADRRACRNV